MKTVGALLVASVSISLFAAIAACNTGGDAASDPQTGDTPIVGNPNGKGMGGQCTVGNDCKSGVCSASKCTHRPRWTMVHGCAGPNDCESKVCTAGVCQAASTDRRREERRRDRRRLRRLRRRRSALRGRQGLRRRATDCTSGVCDPATKTCAKPTATDGVKNADETDIDCGGTLTGAPKCAVAKSCNAHEDCASDGCDDTKQCANGRSCTQDERRPHLRRGRSAAAGCRREARELLRSDRHPGSRDQARQVQDHRGPHARVRRAHERRRARLVRGEQGVALGDAACPDRSRTRATCRRTSRRIRTARSTSSAARRSLPHRPSDSQGCYVGNAANQANGSHTYWNGTLEQEDRGFDQAFLDRLPLNCVTYPMVAAFCAWDGGRVETFEEHSAAYGGATYPWGNSRRGRRLCGRERRLPALRTGDESDRRVPVVRRQSCELAHQLPVPRGRQRREALGLLRTSSARRAAFRRSEHRRPSGHRRSPDGAHGERRVATRRRRTSTDRPSRSRR